MGIGAGSGIIRIFHTVKLSSEEGSAFFEAWEHAILQWKLILSADSMN